MFVRTAKKAKILSRIVVAKLGQGGENVINYNSITFIKVLVYLCYVFS